MAPPPPPPPKTLPYNPKKRLTPATTVLKPLSQAEIAMYKTWVGTGTMKLQKRKREASPDTESAPPAKKRLTRDAVAVVDHYNSRPDVGVLQRQDSPIIGLKNFNNWIKSVLIQRYAYPALIGESIAKGARTRRDRKLFGRVLDIGCGKGGDINKWTKAKIADYVGVDIAAVSVNQARQRWEGMRVNRFNARFAPLDCYEYPLSHALDERYLRAPPIDVVSMQFCMHYAFDSEKRARRMLENVSEYLRPGGAFIGTIPNAESLLDRLDELPDDAQDLEFGNDVYKIKFDERQHEGLYGHKYSFFLQDAVDDVPEYLVHWTPFVKLAEEYGLRLVYRSEFHSVYQEFQEEKEFADLLVRMKVINAEGESAMDEDQWEAANIYIAFAFEKIS
ncbi:guanine-N(7)-methyltransferase [Cylindrobasidium torrendii FP15055 ss-10]|uniref:mRNA cap guanine-N(7) methyltransferase n=1 Tax=Cylindrobasidium torrendii FP15055 ss-10 TaxID=1314674 RepID=A0A0D7BC43_9AGAR|nr:guanine-N(7)-methyltransferase [Cylindrobasidium torrendii FP15055 ss-10]